MSDDFCVVNSFSINFSTFPPPLAFHRNHRVVKITAKADANRMQIAIFNGAFSLLRHPNGYLNLNTPNTFGASTRSLGKREIILIAFFRREREYQQWIIMKFKVFNTFSGVRFRRMENHFSGKNMFVNHVHWRFFISSWMKRRAAKDEGREYAINHSGIMKSRVSDMNIEQEN